MVFKKGHKPWNIGIKLTKEHIKKLSEVHKGQISAMKGKHHTEETKEKISNSCIGREQSLKQKIAIKKANKGNFYTYKNGIAMYRKIAYEIYDKICMKCGSNSSLDVHHIDGDRKNNPFDGSNWEILCRSCHMLYHKELLI